MTKNTRRGQCKFNDAWLDHDDFGQWIQRSVKGDHDAYCTVCKVPIDLGSMGVCALKSHAGLPPYDKLGKKHKKALATVSKNMTLFDFGNTSRNTTGPKPAEVGAGAGPPMPTGPPLGPVLDRMRANDEAEVRSLGDFKMYKVSLFLQKLRGQQLVV
jgi:hypothetical protein